MQLKRYTIASIILMILVAIATYSVTMDKDPVSFDLLGMHFPNLPIAFWIVVPLFFMYLASVIHMGVYAIVGNVKLRRLNKDSEKMIDSLRDALLGVNDRNNVYKSEPYKVMGKLIDNAVVLPSDSLRTVGNESIDEALDLIRDVKEKKRVEMKKFHLPMNSSIVVQDNLNRLERGDLDPDTVVARPESYGHIVASKAFESYVNKATYASVLKLKNLLNIDSLRIFVERVNSLENGLQVTNEELFDLVKGIQLSNSEWIELSHAMSKNMIPDQRIRLFEMISENNDDAMEAYLYTLYDLQMNDAANEILNNTSHNDYQIFKAYRDLKLANKNYDIALFLRK